MNDEIIVKEVAFRWNPDGEAYHGCLCGKEVFVFWSDKAKDWRYAVAGESAPHNAHCRTVHTAIRRAIEYTHTMYNSVIASDGTRFDWSDDKRGYAAVVDGREIVLFPIAGADGWWFRIDGEEPPIVHDFLLTWTVADEALIRAREQEIAQ